MTFIITLYYYRYLSSFSDEQCMLYMEGLSIVVMNNADKNSLKFAQIDIRAGDAEWYVCFMNTFHLFHSNISNVKDNSPI